MIETSVLKRLGHLEGRHWWRLILALTGLLIAGLAAHLGSGGVLFVFWRRTLLVLAVGSIGITLLVLAAWPGDPSAWRIRRHPLSGRSLVLERLRSVSVMGLFGRLGWRGRLAGMLLLVCLFSWLLLGPLAPTLRPLAARLLIVLGASLVGAYLLSGAVPSRLWHAFLFSLLGFAFYYHLLTTLPSLSLTPFSLHWSEGTRYYHASLLLSKRYYGLSLPPFYQDLSRYVVEAVSLLLPRPSLWLTRLWETSLTVLLPALTAALFLRRVTVNRSAASPDPNFPFPASWVWLGFFLWGTLYLLQGPVYFYLLLAAIPVAMAYQPHRPLPSLIALVVASFWAGISRVNWIPVPAMLTIAFYLLETPLARRSLVRYLAWPMIYTLLGLGVALAARWWYFSISDVPAEMFNAAFWQLLLWYRLFPSALQPLGILPAGLLMATPPALIFVFHLRQGYWHWIRIAGLVTMLLVLLVGGFIVSAKIGGGSNLHNLDTYLTLSLAIGLYLIFDRFVPDLEPAGPPRAFPPLLTTLAVLMVVFFVVCSAYPGLPSLERHTDSLARLQNMVDQTVAQGGRVLFISQRHLLTFGLIRGVPLIPEYDNIDLMEFAMTNYRPWIDRFRADIAAHRYDLIIAPAPPGRYKGRDEAFAEESNAWLRRVSIPMLRSYKIIAEFPEGDFVVLAPDR